MNDVCGSRSVDPRILNLDTRWRWLVRFTPREGAHDTHCIRGLVGPQSRSGRSGEENFLPYPHRESNAGRPARSLVTTLSEFFCSFTGKESFCLKNTAHPMELHSDYTTDKLTVQQQSPCGRNQETTHGSSHDYSYCKYCVLNRFSHYGENVAKIWGLNIQYLYIRRQSHQQIDFKLE